MRREASSTVRFCTPLSGRASSSRSRHAVAELDHDAAELAPTALPVVLSGRGWTLFTSTRSGNRRGSSRITGVPDVGDRGLVFNSTPALPTCALVGTRARSNVSSSPARAQLIGEWSGDRLGGAPSGSKKAKSSPGCEECASLMMGTDRQAQRQALDPRRGTRPTASGRPSWKNPQPFPVLANTRRPAETLMARRTCRVLSGWAWSTPSTSRANAAELFMV